MRYTTPYYTSNFYTYVETATIPVDLDGQPLILRVVTPADGLDCGHDLTGGAAAVQRLLTDAGGLALGAGLAGAVRTLRLLAEVGHLDSYEILPVELSGVTLELRAVAQPGAVARGHDLTGQPWTARLDHAAGAVALGQLLTADPDALRILSDSGAATSGHVLGGPPMELYLLAESGYWALLAVPICRPNSRTLSLALDTRSLTADLSTRTTC